MGAGASTDAGGGSASGSQWSEEEVGKWSEEEVGKQVASLGKAFEGYQQLAVDNGIDGEMLLDVDDEELEGLGVSSKSHRKKILKKVEAIKAGRRLPVPAAVVEQRPLMAASGTMMAKGIIPRHCVLLPSG